MSLGLSIVDLSISEGRFEPIDNRQSQSTIRSVTVLVAVFSCFCRLQVEHPDAAARRVHARSSLSMTAPYASERPHDEGVALEVVPHVLEHFIRMPVARQDAVART